MEKRIFLSSPTMHGEEQQFIQEAFDTNWVAPLGKNVNEFEKELAAFVGVGHAAALTAGTAALHLAVKLAGSLGLRREEICGLKWESVDFQRRVVHIKEARTAYGATVVQKETKNRSSMRTLFMPDELYELLRREKARQEQERAIRGGDYAASGHVVLDREGLPYSPNALSLAFTRFVRRNNLPRLTFHGLRHTFATIASCQGASLFDIGKALGHSTPSTTGRIYTHLVDRTHEETLLLVSAALK